MKQFIYLDYDITNSIIAQAEKGLISGVSQEQESGDYTTNKTEIRGAVDAGLNTSFLNLVKAKTNLSVQGDVGTAESISTTSKEIVDKILHDAIFDIACQYIDTSKGCGYGKYIEKTYKFVIVDLDYLESIVNKNSVLDYMDEQNKNKPNKANKQIKDTILILKKLIPYNRMLISDDGYVIPMDEKYFKVEPKNLAFKYGGDISCVGMITNIINKEDNAHDAKDIFSTLKAGVNDILFSILPIKGDTFYLIHPIAIYYNN